jgi:hypothetical protein
MPAARKARLAAGRGDAAHPDGKLCADPKVVSAFPGAAVTIEDIADLSHSLWT